MKNMVKLSTINILLLIVIVVLGGFIVDPVTPAQAATNVGPQASITCPVGATAVSAGTNLATLVFNAAAGTTFCLDPGTYTPPSPIYLKTGDKLIGQYGAIIDGSSVTQSYDAGGITIVSGWNCTSCSNVTIQNLVIRDSTKTIPQCVGAAGNNASNWIIDHNDISGCLNAAVSYGGAYTGSPSSGWQVTYNKIHDTPRYGSFYLGRSMVFSYNDVSAVSAHDGKWANGDHVTITFNTFHDFSANTAMVWLDTVSNSGGHNVVCDNTFTNPGANWPVADIEATDNTEVCRNTFNGGSGTSPEIWIPDSQDIYVHDNTFNFPTAPAVYMFWDGQSQPYYDTCPNGITNAMDPTCDVPVSNPPAYVTARVTVLNNTLNLGAPISGQPFVGYSCSGVTQSACLTSMDTNSSVYNANKYFVTTSSGTYWTRDAGAINFTTWQGAGQDTTGTLTVGTFTVGDINFDHIVNSIDYSVLNSDWFTSNSRSDLNSDGIVNAVDYSILNANWFKTW